MRLPIHVSSPFIICIPASGNRDHNGTERALILSLSSGADKRQVLAHPGTSGDRLYCAPLSTRNSSIDTLSPPDNGVASSRSNGRTRAYLSNGRRNSDESCVMTRYETREVTRAPFDAAPPIKGVESQ